MEQIIDLSRVGATARCPQCVSPNILRGGKSQRGVALNGTALWELSESCMMCGWGRIVPNVRIGA